MRRFFFLCLSVVCFQFEVLADDPVSPIRIVTYNMHGGEGSNGTPPENLNAFKDLLQGEQILCFQEVDDWSLVQSVFSDWPYTYYTENETTAPLWPWEDPGVTAIAIVSKLPLAAMHNKLIQIDPGGDEWERHAQHVQVSIDGDRVLHVFHFHNTYNWNYDDFEYEQYGMEKFRDYVYEELETTGVNEAANVVMLGDYNLFNAKVDVILPTTAHVYNGRDHLNSPMPFRDSGVYATASMNLSDHNAVWATVDPGQDHGQVVFEATTANTTLFNNGVAGDASNITLTGATPDLLLASDGGDFFAGGFASTETINMLLGSALSSNDTVMMSITVDSATHTDSSQLRSRGLEFGMAAEAIMSGGGSASNFIVRVGGAGNGAVIQLVDGSSGTITSAVFRATEASVEDGFRSVIVADKDGFTIYFNGLEAVSGTVGPVSGTFEEGHFANAFGGGHYYASVQKRLSGTTTVDVSDATLSVTIGGQGEAPEFIAGGTSVSGGNLVVGFTGSVGYEYSIESTDDLTNSNSWTVVTNIAALPESPMEVALPATNSAAFYRVLGQ